MRKMCGASGQEAAEPRAVDAAVDEECGLACVEEQRGAGGEFAVDEDEIAGALLCVDGEREIFGAEDGVEADVGLVHGEEDADHGGGDEEVRGEGTGWFADSTYEVLDGAEDKH